MDIERIKLTYAPPVSQQEAAASGDSGQPWWFPAVVHDVGELVAEIEWMRRAQIRLEDVVRAGGAVLIFLDEYTDPPDIAIAIQDTDGNAVANGIGMSIRDALADWLEEVPHV